MVKCREVGDFCLLCLKADDERILRLVFTQKTGMMIRTRGIRVINLIVLAYLEQFQNSYAGEAGGSS